ncbi:hypothetical protein [Arthrobacter sp. H41]|uniref:hypothetical protein n=1 Tax=Arthrobacter sp. H41 TaxID=1312978 RepID=UPI0012DD14FE|nr:hypothetical protein [Arthrobacter sp. H41]
MKVRYGISAIMLAGLLTGTAACGSETGPSSSEATTAPSEAAAPESAAATTGAAGASATGSASAEEAPAEEVMITITDFEYEMPESIAPGAMVTVVNEDSAPHTVTAEDDGGFDERSSLWVGDWFSWPPPVAPTPSVAKAATTDSTEPLSGP